MKKKLSTSDALIVVLAIIALFAFLFCDYCGLLGKGLSGINLITEVVAKDEKYIFVLLHILCPIFTIWFVLADADKDFKRLAIYSLPVPVILFICFLNTDDDWKGVNLENGAILYLICSIGCICLNLFSQNIDKINIGGSLKNDNVVKSENLSSSNSSSNVTTDLIQLKELLDDQAITQEEYETIKAKLLSKLK